MKIGILSDTHGYLEPKIYAVFNTVDHIIHAGDIGNHDILLSLRTLAPVTAVYGNMDGYDIRRHVKETESLDLLGYQVIITHIPGQPKQSVEEDNRIIRIYGHTHHPEINGDGKSMVINPGSASRPPSYLAASVAYLYLDINKTPRAEIVSLS